MVDGQTVSALTPLSITAEYALKNTAVKSSTS